MPLVNSLTYLVFSPPPPPPPPIQAEKIITIYVPFCQGKMASEELLASHRSYLTRVQSLFGIETPLSSLMIKPIQRITKYPLLFRVSVTMVTMRVAMATCYHEGCYG